MDDDFFYFPLVLLVAYDKRRLLGLLLALLGSVAIKAAFPTVRPDGTLGDIPSSHVATAAVLWDVAPLLLIYALFSRLVFHHHSIVGVLAGLLWGLVCWLLLYGWPILLRDKQR